MAYKYLGERYVVQASWEDASAHLTEEARTSLMASIPAWQRDARSKGIPQLGSGAVFQLSESEYVVPQLTKGVPSHWPRSYALDVGIRVAAAMWIAQNPDDQIYYVYSEYEREDVPYSIHAAAIKAKGDWICGVVDPAADQRNQVDGERMIDNYRRAGLTLTEAENSVSSGLEDLIDALTSGKLKIIETCQKLIRQMRVYRRDDKGKIVKKNDHLVDSLRYGWVSGRNVMKIRSKPAHAAASEVPSTPRGWMA